ncbi:formate hydrogenlyase subunit 3 [Klebsiella pneumoniae]|uniref:Formate hydrogenlyase subunit 3 n=1 Tax=Klebsiella pneumoniae TaxID=573 RepID=A0A378FS81_KLEPN|nr:formate hydrogenlyase subunit 3 [Klebsiella pneumoniae]
MSVIGLVNQAVAWYAASAVLAFLFAMRKPLSGAIAGIGGAVASAMLVVAGGAALLMPERIHGGMLQFLHLTIRVGGVNALWLLAIGLSALPVSLFNISWHRHPQVKANGPLVNLLLAAATCAVVVTNIGSLVVMAEIMALCAAFLTGCAASGKLWFALGRLGTLLMAWTCWLVWSNLRHPRAGADRPSGGGYYAEPAALVAGSGGVRPAGRGDPAARLGAAGSRRGQRAGRRAVFHGGNEGWSVRHADRFAGRRRAAAVVGRDAAGAGDAHRLYRRTVCADGA